MLYYLVMSLPCIACLFWAIAIGIRSKKNHLSQQIWVFSLIAMAISTSVWGFFFSGVNNYSLFYKLEVLEAFSTLLLPALLYFCFRSLTNEKPFSWKMYIWLAPAFIIGGAIATLYLSIGEDQAVAHVRDLVQSRGAPTDLSGTEQIMAIISGPVYSILVLAQMIFVLIYAAVRLIHYRERLSDFYSNLEGKSLENYRALLMGGCLILVLSLSTYRGRFYYNEQSLFLVFHMISWVVLISFMGYNAYKMGYTVQTLAEELEKADLEADALHFDSPDLIPAEKLSGEMSGKKYTELLAVFEKLMNEEQIFLQYNLRMDDVARMMHTNRTYISRMINEEFDCSFSDCINYRRIEYAQDLMRSNPQFTQVQIAEKAGFSSASAFSRMFRQQTGVTFVEWRRDNI